MRTIIGGKGDVVYFLAKALTARGHEVTIVDSEPSFCLRMAELTAARVIQGDPTRAEVLIQAGADEADVCLALSQSDPQNLVTCALARRQFGVPRTLALVNDPDNGELFARLGVTQTLAPVSMISGFVSASVAAEAIVNLFTVDEGRLAVVEVEVRGDDPAAGVAAAELALPEGAALSAVVRDGRLYDPRGPVEIAAGDRVIIITDPAVERPALEAITRVR